MLSQSTRLFGHCARSLVHGVEENQGWVGTLKVISLLSDGAELPPPYTGEGRGGGNKYNCSVPTEGGNLVRLRVGKLKYHRLVVG